LYKIKQTHKCELIFQIHYSKHNQKDQQYLGKTSRESAAQEYLSEWNVRLGLEICHLKLQRKAGKQWLGKGEAALVELNNKGKQVSIKVVLMSNNEGKIREKTP
jgi:hypothetical protein